MKLLSLNLFKGKCLDEVVAFLKEERFDLVHLQEVAGGSVSFPKIDCFAHIKKESGLQGVLLPCWHRRGEKEGYFGNATLYGPALALKEQKQLRFKPFQELDYSADASPATHPKSVLFLRFEHEGQDFWSLNTHLAWGPTPFDEPYKVKDAQRLAHALSIEHIPFILSGDFNVVSNTEVIKLLEPFGRNLTQEYGLTNTLDPQLHKAQHLFPPGLAVDYIFTHPSITVTRFEALSHHHLSDHIGLIAEFFLC